MLPMSWHQTKFSGAVNGRLKTTSQAPESPYLANDRGRALVGHTVPDTHSITSPLDASKDYDGRAK